MRKQFDEASQFLYEQTGLYIEEVISMIRGLEKKVDSLEQSVRSLEDGDVELYGQINDSNISKNTLERKVDSFINQVKPIISLLKIGGQNEPRR